MKKNVIKYIVLFLVSSNLNFIKLDACCCCCRPTNDSTQSSRSGVTRSAMHRAPDAQGMQDSTISVEAVRDSNFDLIRVDPVQSSTANRSQNYLQPIPRHQNSQNSRSSDHIPFPDSGHLRLGQPDVRTNAAQQASDSEMPHTQASAAIPVRDQWIASHNADQQESMGNNVLSAADSAVNTGQMNGVFALDEGDWMTLVITRTLDAMGLERMPIPETTNSASSSQLATAIPMDEPIAALPEAQSVVSQDLGLLPHANPDN